MTTENCRMTIPKQNVDPIRIHSIAPGEARFGGTPKGVLVTFKEHSTLPGNPNRAYLVEVLERKGYQTADADRVEGAPLLRLSVTKPGAQVRPAEVCDSLKDEPELDLSKCV